MLRASGEGVGLPWGEMGNSEVGHINLGAGKIVVQNLPRITQAISDGSFFKNEAFLGAINNVKEKKSKLHLMGLLGPGGAHSYDRHIFALLEFAMIHKIENVYLHLFTDGRDTSPKSALLYLESLRREIKKIGIGKIATIGGRYYGMDRDKHWDRIATAYNAMVLGVGNFYEDAETAVQDAYDKGLTDQYMEVAVIQENGKPVATVEEGDSVIFFNFRPDRAVQIAKMFTLPSLPQKVKREKKIDDLTFVSMTEYDRDLPVAVAFKPVKVEYPIARVISEAGLKQLHIAETEKYAHVTAFFDGGQEGNFSGEEKVLIPSPSVPRYDEEPEMSARELTDRLLREISTNKYAFIVVNFANCDMVGHTGNIEAAKKAVETVDNCIGRIASEVLSVGGAMVVTADHGNCEHMQDVQTGMMETEHTINPVPLIIVAKGFEADNANPFNPNTKPSGVLGDVAPTLIELMGLNKPRQMNGISFASKGQN